MSKNNRDQTEGAKLPRNLRVLVAPLDWGLGHATRCIPVICDLLAAGNQVWLAGEGAQEHLLREAFPKLPFLQLKGYQIRYGRSAKGTTWNLIRQLPKIRKQIRAEFRWLQRVQQEYQFDLVISDNRYGLQHPDIHSIFITHQLWIIHPWGKWASRFLQRWNYRQIERFNACWIPDEAAAPGLAGMLSHPGYLPGLPIHYIGAQSRLTRTTTEEKPGHLFISLSGPEPQRSLLEDKIIQQIAHYAGTACIVRGLPHERSLIPSTNSLSFYNHLDTASYQQEMSQAEWVICRSGYSSIMDIMALGKKSILVPTPGQTEQEYLARHLSEFNMACWEQQEKFDLMKAIQQPKPIPFSPALRKSIVELLF